MATEDGRSGGRLCLSERPRRRLAALYYRAEGARAVAAQAEAVALAAVREYETALGALLEQDGVVLAATTRVHHDVDGGVLTVAEEG